jgi:hypothetical protein
MADNSLPQDTFRPISALAVGILARQQARRAVTEQLRAEGARVSLIPPAIINSKATEYLAAHPEIYDEARERAVRLGMFEKRRRKQWLEK